MSGALPGPYPTPTCPKCGLVDGVRRIADLGQEATHRCARCRLNFSRGRVKP